MGWADAPVVSKWQMAPPVTDAPAAETAPDMTPGRRELPDGYKFVAPTSDGGEIYRKPGGMLGYVGPTASLDGPEHQATIRKMLEGMDAAEAIKAAGQEAADKTAISERPVSARALKALEGVPFVGSWLDEAVGATMGDTARDAWRATSGAMDRQNPNESTALNIGGAVAGSIPAVIAGGPAVVANAGKTFGVRALQAAVLGGLVGGAEGAAYGAGKEGDRAGNAMFGGGIGTIGGVVLGAAAPYVGAGVASVWNRLKGSDVAVIQSQFGISRLAARTIKSALDSGDIRKAQNTLRRAGGDAMLADAGQPARELLDAAAKTGGRAGQIVSDAVNTRVAKEASNLTVALDKTFGKPQGRASIARDIRTGTATSRQDAYDLAYSMPIDYSGAGGQAIEGALARVPASAINTANALMKAEGHESAQILIEVGKDGAVTFKRLPDVRQIDYITRALNDVAAKEDGAGKLGGKTQLGGAYEALSRQLRGLVRGQVPEYGAALDIASDAISQVNAGKLGYSLLKSGTTREDVAEAMKGASAAEIAAAKKGVRSFIDDTLANVRAAFTDPNTDVREAAKALKDLSSRANRDKLATILGPKQAVAFFRDLDKATVAFELKAAVAENSKTAIRGAIQGTVKSGVRPGALETLAAGKPVEAAKRFVEIFTGDSAEAQAIREAGVFEEIARALTGKKGADARAALNLVTRAMSGQQVTGNQAAFIGQTVARTLALTGSHEASTQLSTQRRVTPQ